MEAEYSVGSLEGAGCVQADVDDVEWEQRLRAVELPTDTLEALVMNYFVVEGHRNAAEAFARESVKAQDFDLKSMDSRVAVKNAVLNGDIPEAVNLLNDLNPEILEDDAQLYFRVRLQELIEMIRNGSVEDVVDFAQIELAPLCEEQPALVEELEACMALLAFENPGECAWAERMDVSRRAALAADLNAAILSSQCQTREALLPGRLKGLVWLQQELGSDFACPGFPKMNLSSDDTMQEDLPSE